MLVSGHACNRGGSELADGQRSRITWTQTRLRRILAQFAGYERGILLTLEELDNAKAVCNYDKNRLRKFSLNVRIRRHAPLLEQPLRHIASVAILGTPAVQ